MCFLKRILSSLEARLSQPKLNPLRTLYVNFRTLPFRHAVKLPVFIYGKVHFFILDGEIEIRGPVRRGMIQFGRNTESFALNDRSGFIQLNRGCKLVFEGPARIGVNSKVRLTRSVVTLGRNVFIGSGVRLIANGSRISIGQGSRIAFESVIMNSGFHYVYNRGKGGYGAAARPVEIGDFNWIGNRSTVSGNARTKPFTIVCSGSLLNKDYTRQEGDGPMLGGSPAKLIAAGVRRVFSPRTHAAVARWFREHPDESFYHADELPDPVEDLDAEFK